VEGLARLVVAGAAARALAKVEDMRREAWVTVITEPCGLEVQAGLPPSMGLPHRTAQIAEAVVGAALTRALESLRMRRMQKWNAMTTECPCPSRFGSGLPPAKGLPKRAVQLAGDVVASAVQQAKARVASPTSLASIATTNDASLDSLGPMPLMSSSCVICLGELRRPVELPCGHMFCADCLLRLISQERRFRSQSCPMCRGILFRMPEDEIEDADSEYAGSEYADSEFALSEYRRGYNFRRCFFIGDWFFYCSCQRL